jgi:hypothetical protein
MILKSNLKFQCSGSLLKSSTCVLWSRRWRQVIYSFVTSPQTVSGWLSAIAVPSRLRGRIQIRQVRHNCYTTIFVCWQIQSRFDTCGRFGSGRVAFELPVGELMAAQCCQGGASLAPWRLETSTETSHCPLKAKQYDAIKITIMAWLMAEHVFAYRYIIFTDRQILNCKYIRVEVFTAVTMKNGVFWNVTPCGSCKNRQICITSQRASVASYR